MTDKVQKIREEVEMLFNHVKDSNFESDSGAFYYLKDLLDYIDSLQEEPVIVDAPPYDYVKGFSDGRLYEKRQKEEPVSEFLNTESMIESYKQRLISQANGMKNSPLIDMCLASYKHGVNETLDTLNLSNVQRTTKNWKEPVSEDLGDYINELSKQFPEVSFAKLSRIAVRVANWQKKQDQETIELAEDHAMLAGIIKGTEHTVGKVRSILNKVAYRNNGLDVNGDYCEQPYIELDDEIKKLLKEN